MAPPRTLQLLAPKRNIDGPQVRILIPHRVTVLPVIEKGDGQDADVNDEHDQTATRSPRRPAAAIRRALRSPGQHLVGVGGPTSAISFGRRYSCGDWCTAATRCRSTACVSSGTSLINVRHGAIMALRSPLWKRLVGMGGNRTAPLINWAKVA